MSRDLTEDQLQNDTDALKLLIEKNDLEVRIRELVGLQFSDRARALDVNGSLAASSNVLRFNPGETGFTVTQPVTPNQGQTQEAEQDTTTFEGIHPILSHSDYGYFANETEHGNICNGVSRSETSHDGVDIFDYTSLTNGTVAERMKGLETPANLLPASLRQTSIMRMDQDPLNPTTTSTYGNASENGEYMFGQTSGSNDVSAFRTTHESLNDIRPACSGSKSSGQLIGHIDHEDETTSLGLARNFLQACEPEGLKCHVNIHPRASIDGDENILTSQDSVIFRNMQDVVESATEQLGAGQVMEMPISSTLLRVLKPKQNTKLSKPGPVLGSVQVRIEPRKKVSDLINSMIVFVRGSNFL